MSVWMATRQRQSGETRLMIALAEVVQENLADCPACTEAYNTTGAVPLTCNHRQAERDATWLATVESLARSRLNGGRK